MLNLAAAHGRPHEPKHPHTARFIGESVCGGCYHISSMCIVSSNSATSLNLGFLWTGDLGFPARRWQGEFKFAVDGFRATTDGASCSRYGLFRGVKGVPFNSICFLHEVLMNLRFKSYSVISVWLNIFDSIKWLLMHVFFSLPLGDLWHLLW